MDIYEREKCPDMDRIFGKGISENRGIRNGQRDGKMVGR